MSDLGEIIGLTDVLDHVMNVAMLANMRIFE